MLLCLTFFTKKKFKKLRDMETCFIPNSALHADIPTLRLTHRCILVEFLIDVSRRGFKLSVFSEFLTMHILDKFTKLHPSKVCKQNYQMIGMACLMLATTSEETLMISLKDAVYVCEKLFTCEDLRNCMMDIFKSIDGDMEASKTLICDFYAQKNTKDMNDHIVAMIIEYFRVTFFDPFIQDDFSNAVIIESSEILAFESFHESEHIEKKTEDVESCILRIRDLCQNSLVFKTCKPAFEKMRYQINWTYHKSQQTQDGQEKRRRVEHSNFATTDKHCFT
jgi:hypothetical protein